MCARAATPHPVVSVRVGVCAASMSLDFVSRHELVSTRTCSGNGEKKF